MRPARGILVLLCLSVSMLAGCADDAPDAQPDASPSGSAGGLHGEHQSGTHLLAPNWTLGDWWSWTSPQIDGPYSSVLAADQGSDWLMATDHEEIAFFDARFDIASLGQVSKGDLAGSQGSTRVAFFQFPLAKDKTWTTTWDGLPMTILVTDVQNGVADLEARRADGTLYAAYTYKDSHGYFGQIEYYDATGSEVGFEATVSSAGHAFSADLVRWNLEAAVDLHGAIPTGQATTYEVPATITDVYLSAVVNCTAGAVSIATGPPQGPADNRGYSAVGPCPMASFDEYVAAPAPAQTETWGLIANAAPTTTGTLDLTVWLRTKEVFQVAGTA